MHTSVTIDLIEDSLIVHEAIVSMPIQEWLDCLQTREQNKECTTYVSGAIEMQEGKSSGRARKERKAKGCKRAE